MNKQINYQESITATALNESQRLQVLPELFDQHMMRFEAYVYGWMGRLAEEYDGAYWDIYRLSNGGFYMAPSSLPRYKLCVVGNGFEGALSADAAGIVVTLFALNQLAWEVRRNEIADLYHWLRDYAANHAEAALIFRAID